MFFFFHFGHEEIKSNHILTELHKRDKLLLKKIVYNLKKTQSPFLCFVEDKSRMEN